MKVGRVRVILMCLFLLGFAAQVAAIISVGDKIFSDERQALIMRLLTIYSVHLSVVLGGIFAHRPNPKARTSFLGWSAILVVLLWNALLVWRSVAFSVASQDSAAQLASYLEQVGSASSFLVSGALTFFFVKSADSFSPRESGA